MMAGSPARTEETGEEAIERHNSLVVDMNDPLNVRNVAMRMAENANVSANANVKRTVNT